MVKGQNPGKKKMRTEVSPDILMFNILPRLPGKSVGRFRCVSKEWHSFLTTPHFANMHLLHQNHQKLLLLSSTKPYTFRTIDCETTKKDASRSLPFEKDGYSSTLQMSIVASFQGLVCLIWGRLNKVRVPFTDLILWNPLTGDYKTLSKPSCHDECYYITFDCQFGLYYSTSEDDYKLLCVTNDPNRKVYIYSLKSDSWRKVETTMRNLTSNCICIYSEFCMPNLLLNEKLYFLRQQHIYGEVDPSYVIMMFDTMTEKLREIVTPTIRRVGTECNGFMVLRGSVHLCVAFTDPRGHEYDTIELWRMKIGSDGDWTKVVTYVWRREKPLHIMSNGDWLVYSPGLVYKRDMNKHTHGDFICRFKSMDMNLGWKYMESLVSPNQYK